MLVFHSWKDVISFWNEIIYFIERTYTTPLKSLILYWLQASMIPHMQKRADSPFLSVCCNMRSAKKRKKALHVTKPERRKMEGKRKLYIGDNVFSDLYSFSSMHSSWWVAGTAEHLFTMATVSHCCVRTSDPWPLRPNRATQKCLTWDNTNTHIQALIHIGQHLRLYMRLHSNW